MNLRTNGYEFHMDLTTPEARARGPTSACGATFANWRELIDMGAYIDNHHLLFVQEALPFMDFQGDAAMLP